MIVSTNDTKFLSSLMDNPDKIVLLSKEVIPSDFSDITYYDIYSKIIEYIIDSKNPSYTDLKVSFRTDALVLEIIGVIEEEGTVDLETIYSALIDDSKKEQLKKTVATAASQLDSFTTKTQDIINAMEADLARINSNFGIQLSAISSFDNEVMTSIIDRAKVYNKTKDISSVIEMPTGITKLDEYTLGFHRKNTWILAAETSDGKTQLAVQFACSVINAGKTCMYFLLEDAKENLIYRILSNKTGIKLFNIRCGMLSDRDIIKLKAALDQIKQTNRLFVEDSYHNVNDIVNQIRFAKLKHPNLSFIVMDHIGLAVDRGSGSNNGNREQEIAMVSKKLVNVAKQCDVAILILQQLNTDPDKRGKGMPIRNNDLRESKSTGHDAAVNLFIHFPQKYSKEANYSKKYGSIIIGKNRYGENNKMISVINYAATAKFVEGNTPEGIN